MANKLDIYNEEWCDLLFENRNQEYGAYDLRKTSGKHHLTAILVTLVVFGLALSLPMILKRVLPKKAVKIAEVTTLSNLQLENQKKFEKAKDVVVEEVKPIKATIKFTPPVIKPDQEVADTMVMKTTDELNQSKAAISTADVKGVNDDPDAVDITQLNQIVEDTTSKPYVYVEQMPEFPGGSDQLLAYIARNLKYPEVALENGLSGMVIVQFVINTQGNVSNIQVLRGFDESCEKEAVRVIKSMPKWTPGRQNGQPVRVQMVLPVNFKLQ